jgi:hypothetical protein
MFGRTKWNRTKRLRSHADRHHTRGKHLVKRSGFFLLLVSIGFLLAVLVPRPLEEPVLLEKVWDVQLKGQVGQDAWGTEADESSVVSLWTDDRLYFVDVETGELLSSYSAADVVAYSESLFIPSQDSSVGLVVYRYDGVPAFRLSADGNALFYSQRLFLVSPFLDAVQAYSLDGEMLWQQDLEGMITALAAGSQGSLIGMSNGSLISIKDDGQVEIVREADGFPIAGIGIAQDAIWLVIAGEQPCLEYISRKGQRKILHSLPLGGPLRTVMPVKAFENRVFLSELSLLADIHGDYSRCGSCNYFEIDQGEYSMMLFLQDDTENRLELRPIGSESPLLELEGDFSALRLFQDDGFIVYSSDRARRYRIIRSMQ